MQLPGGLNFLKNGEVKAEKWERLLQKNKFASVFQSPAFYQFYNSLQGYAAEVFALEQGQEYVALCVVTFQKEKGLKGYFSRRAIVYGGPLMEQPEHLPVLLAHILKQAPKVIYTEVRNYFDYSASKEMYLKTGWGYIPYLNFELRLEHTNAAAIAANMKYNRRREIRLSKEQGAEYAEAKSLEEVKGVYAILEALYKTRVKLPLPGIAYFEQLFLSGIGKVYVVKHAGTIIGGCFCLLLPGNRLYTQYYCGLRDYHKKIFPTHLAIMAAIEGGLEQNIKVLDFMGAGQKGEAYGVRNYKEEFGGTLVEHGRFMYVHNKALYAFGKLGLWLLKKIKP